MIVPTLRYEDAKQAIDWLCQAFGFEKRAVYPGEGDKIAHAELTYGNGMVMLGSGTDSDHGRFISTPSQAGTTTQSAYVAVEDIDAHHARASMGRASPCRSGPKTTAASIPASTPKATYGASATTTLRMRRRQAEPRRLAASSAIEQRISNIMVTPA